MDFNLISFFLLLSLLSFRQETQEKAETTKWLLNEDSNLIVNGFTNVSRFSCAVIPSAKVDTVMLSKNQSGTIFLSGAIKINISEFDCSNTLMTRELKKTLKGKEFPYLHIRFISLKIAGNYINGQVEIELAGKCKSFQIQYQLTTLKDKLILTGKQAIHFSDFNLQPPTKMGKLIKAKDKLEVALNLKLEPI